MTKNYDTNILDIESLMKYLLNKNPGVVVQRKIGNQIIEKLELDIVYHYLKKFSESKSWIHRNFSCYILPHCFQNIKYRDPVEKILLDLADDEDWRVRESVTWAFYKLCKDNFKEVYPLFKDWGTHDNENVRRAIIIAAMRMGKHREKKYAEPFLDLIELFLTDKNRYVQKAIIFAVGDGFLRYYPDYTFSYLKSWIKSSDVQVRRIIAMSLSTAEAKKHINNSLEILRELSSDNHKSVKNVVVKSLVNLAQKYPKRVCEKLKMGDNNPNIDYIVNRILQQINNNV